LTHLNTHSSCIVSQVHIPEYDVQGSLHYTDKKKLVEFRIRHLRAFNPNAYIIITGHGYKPSNLSLADFYYWNDVHEPLNEHGYVINMPAQYKYVYEGLAHAQSKGFTNVLKTRGDCIIGHRNITDYCDSFMNGKKLLITQQTGPERMGDCFMYGSTDLLCKIWHKDNYAFHSDGLQNTAHHYRRAVEDLHGDWKAVLLKHCVLKDVDRLLFTCLRWNYYALNELSMDMQKEMLSNSFLFTKYHWGLSNGWIKFDANRKMIGTDKLSYCERCI